MKKIILSIMLISLLLVACSNSLELTINGKTISIETSHYSDEQVETLKAIADGQTDIRTASLQGIFTRDELSDLGLMQSVNTEEEKKVAPLLDSVDLSNFSEEQRVLIDQAIIGDITMSDLKMSDLFTEEEIMKLVPSFGNMPGAKKDFSYLLEKDLSQYTEEQINIIKQVANGELGIRELQNNPLFSEEEFQTLFGGFGKKN